MATNMFSALETSGDQSPRRRWTTVASFTLQALGLSLLLAIPLLTVQGPPRLEWITSPFFAPPSRACATRSAERAANDASDQHERSSHPDASVNSGYHRAGD